MLARRNATRVVLVTGANGGIGAATVERLAAEGYRVFASARRAESVRALSDAGRDQGFEAVQLDVEDEASVARAVADVIERAGSLDVVVNNAGYGVIAPMETVTPEALRAQFETNVIGAHRVVRAVLPGMRARRFGSIVQISSIVGRVALPLYGAYAASKFALEAMSDALRIELAPFGIRVVLIEPGPIRTGFSAAAHRASDGAFNDERAGAYRGLIQRMQAARARTRETGGLGPEAVADAIARALASSSPAARYPVTSFAKIVPPLQSMLPSRLFDRLVRLATSR